MTQTPREHWLETPQGGICWFEWGEPSERPSLLLLHATGFHARLWDQVVAALPPDAHVVAPDHRGHGRSSKPASLADWAVTCDILLPLVDRFAGRPMIGCGHSMGGYVLTRLAALRPAAFDHAVLVDPVIMEPALYEGAADRPPPNPADHPVARRRDRWDSADQMRERFADRTPYSRWRSEVLGDYCEYGLLPAPDTGGELYLACPPALEASVYQNALRTNPYDWLADFQAPASLIRAPTGERDGELDFAMSPTWLGLADKIGAERDELWAEHSHFIPMEAPGRLAALLTEIQG